MPEKDLNPQDRELKTFGFTGKLRTGLVTAIMGIMLTAIVFLWKDNNRKNEEIVDKQQELYEKMIREIKVNVKHEVNETVVPTAQKLDTVASKLDTATRELKEKIKNVK